MPKKLLLLLILILISSQQILWVIKDNSNPSWDQSWNAMAGIAYYRQIIHGIPFYESIRSFPIIGFASSYYPPFLHITTVPFYLLFGTTYDSALLANLFFLAVLIFSLYAIGKKLFSEDMGILLSFLGASCPIYLNYLTDFLIEYPLSAMVALGLASLLYSKHFSNKRFSVIFGIILGLGMLTKWTYIIYIFVPLIYSIARWHHTKTKKYSYVILPFIISVSIASLWYLPRLPFILYNFSQISSAGSVEGLFEQVIYYPLAMASGFSLVLLALFIVSAAAALKRKNRPATAYLASIIFILAVFFINPHKVARYILPIYIYLSIIIISFVHSCPNNRKRDLAILILLSGGLQILAMNHLVTIDYSIGRVPVLRAAGQPYLEHDADIPKILGYLVSAEKYSVCIITETDRVNDINTAFYAMSEGLNITKITGNGCNPLLFDYSVLGPIDNTLRSANFEKSKNILNSNLDKFTLVKENAIPGVSIYRKNPE